MMTILLHKFHNLSQVQNKKDAIYSLDAKALFESSSFKNFMRLLLYARIVYQIFAVDEPPTQRQCALADIAIHRFSSVGRRSTRTRDRSVCHVSDCVSLADASNSTGTNAQSGALGNGVDQAPRPYVPATMRFRIRSSLRSVTGVKGNPSPNALQD